MTRHLAIAVCLATGAACAESHPPGSVGALVAQLDDAEQREGALKELGQLGDKTAVPAVMKWFETPGDWQPSAAFALGQLGDASVVPKLLLALDYTVGTGRDPGTRLRKRVNINVARALGELGDPQALKPLLQLTQSAEPRIRESAIRALGALGQLDASEAMVEIALNDSEPFLRRVAVESLGELKDPRSVPALTKLMFIEVPGISFYIQARMALIQIGDPAKPHLLTTLQRRNKEVESIRLAGGAKIAEGAIEAKAAHVLGALGAKEAERDMVAALKKYYDKYRRQRGSGMFASVPGAIRELSFALGNIGSRSAVRTLLSIVKETDPPLREAAAEALVLIGETGAVKTLVEAAKSGDTAARESAMRAASLLGQGGDLPAFDALTGSGNADVPADTLKQMVGRHRARLVAASECLREAACWRKKVGAGDAVVRQRAAYELGWLGVDGASKTLLKATEDENAEVRMAAVASLRKVGGASSGELRAVHDRWKSKIEYQGVNRELRVLIANLESAAGGAK